MEYKVIQQHFESLPPEAQTLVADFIMFLQQRYQHSSATQQTQHNFRGDPFVGLWQDREDFKDSTQWVRMTRSGEWRD